MADPFTQLLAQYRFPANPAWVMPAYDGHSIVNLAHSFLAHFGAPHATPLAWHDEFAARLAGKRKVLFLLLDGLGWLNLRCVEERDGALFPGAARWPLTSVFPSTTTAALAAYTTGLPPAAHGLIGFSMYLPAYGRIFNMLNFTALDDPRVTLPSLGFQPLSYLGHPGILARLRESSVMAGSFISGAYADSGLSLMLYHDCRPYPYIAFGDLLGLALEMAQAPLPQFQFLYWANLDNIAHLRGARSEGYALELRTVERVIYEQLLPRLDAETAVVIGADHGHLDGDDNLAINLMDLPGLIELFRVPPAGEGMATHIFLQPGTEARAREIISGIAGMTVLTKAELLAMGLLGKTPLRPGLDASIGDLLLLPHGGRRLLYSYQPRPHTAMIGRHGGMSPEEMVVPLLAL